jgi:hypothetical protein
VALQRSGDGAGPLRSEPLAGRREIRPAPDGRVASGTLACPRCDAPVALARPASPASPLACPFCDHAGALRDFLSLGAPSRPARVVVRLAG